MVEEQIAETEEVIVVNKAKLQEIIANGSLEFDEWTSLISEIEKTCPDSIETIRLVYDSFLSEFPLCYGYWRKYINHSVRLCTIDKVVEVFERAVLSATYCVDLWVDYCNFGAVSFEDSSDVIRLFKRALSFVGKDYLSHALWDKYIEFEFSLKHWSSLAYIYTQTLRFPTKRLYHYYHRFKKLVEVWETEMESGGNSSLTEPVEPILDSEACIRYNQHEIVHFIKELLDPSIGSARFKLLQKYKYLGELFFQESSKLNEKINCFEIRIKRPYFHVNPLDVNQLENWHQYLDFAELHGDFDWAVKLYERCLIPCANYPEFWMRYVDFMESRGGQEIANFAMDRATTIFLKRASVMHLFNARFKELIGDASNARASFLQCNTESDSDFVENVVMRSNMEKRLGNFTAASIAYEKAIEMSAKTEKWHIVPVLYVHFSQLKCMNTDSEDAARDILIDGIKHVPCCKLLIEELIQFVKTHGGSRHLNVIDSIVADAISPGTGESQGLSAEDREKISRLYLEYADLCGTVHDVRKAWNRHIRLFPPSVRTTLFHPAMGRKQWKIAIETADTLFSLLHQPSAGSSPICLMQSSLQEKKLSSPKTNDTKATYPSVAHISDQKSPLLANHTALSNQVAIQESPFLETHNELSDQAKVELLQSGESDNIIHESVREVSLKVSEPSGDDFEQNLSLDKECQVANGSKSAPTSLAFSKGVPVLKAFDHDSKHDSKPLSLEGLSLDPLDDKSPGSISPASNPSGDPPDASLSDGSLLKSEPPQEHRMSNENMLECVEKASVDFRTSSPEDTQVTVPAQPTLGHVSLSSANNQNIIAQAVPQPQSLGCSDKDWHRKSNSDRFRRDSKYGFRGHPRRRPYRQRQSSPRQTQPRSEQGSQMPMNPFHQSQPQPSTNPQVQQGGHVQSQYLASAVHHNPAASQVWPMHNPQQQNLSPACPSQPPVQPALYPQSQMLQNPMQCNDQHGNLQNTQAYNQMWQYYYYQQQQLLMQQQQLLQHQQPQQQQLLQQQLLQMQYLQQQQGQQLQPQQQSPYEQQLLQQLQQQGQLQQQQPQLLQQHIIYVQQQQQMGVQQQQHQRYHQHQMPPSEQHPYEQAGQPKHQTNISQVQDHGSNTGESGN